MKHVFIIDSKTFRGQEWKMDSLIDKIGQYFRTQERANFSVLFSHRPRDAMQLIQKQASGVEDEETIRVYAVGGDDVLFDCLNGIEGLPNMELVIMPYGGDTKGFIRSFGEKKAELFRDLVAVTTSPTITTDVIKVGYNWALNGCSVGFIPAISTRMKDIKARRGKTFGRLLIGFLFFVNRVIYLFNKELTAHPFEITIDDTDYSGNYSLINVVNGPYFGRKNVLAGSLPDDGFMDVLLFKSAGPFVTTLSLLMYTQGGKLPPNCVRVQAKKVELKSETPVWIQTDNEFLRDTHISFEVLPGAVQVVAVNNLTYQGF
jgi:diacylglycerol kinase family enzyme